MALNLILVLNVLLIICYLCAHWIFKEKKYINEIFSILPAIQITCLYFFRDPYVSNDAKNYYRGFYEINNYYTWNDFYEYDWETGYVFLNKFFGACGFSFEQMVLAISFFICLSVYLFYSRYSENMVLSYLLFVLFGYFGIYMCILRQSLAFAILLFAIPHIKSKNFIKFLFFVVLAALFHSSALFFVLLYPINKIAITKSNIVIMFLIMIFTMVFSNPIVSFLNDFVGTDYEVANSGGYSMLLLLLVLFSIFLFYSTRLTEESLNNELFIQMMYLGCLMQILALDFSILSRVTYYFTISLTILAPNMTKLYEKKELVVFNIGIIVFGIFYYVMVLNFMSAFGVDEYSFIF